MKEEWTNQLRQKLAGHEKMPPAGLWKDISEQMGFSTEPVRSTTFTRRWYWAAAAVLALVGFFALYQYNDSKQPLQAEVVQQQPVSQQTGETKPVVNEPLQETPVIAVAQTNKPHAIQVEEQKPEVQETVVQKEEATIETKEVAMTPTNEVATTAEKKTETKQESTEVKKTTLDFDKQPLEYTTTPSRQWSVGINTSSGLLAANALGKMDALSYLNDDANSIPLNNQTETEYKAEHHLPIRFGLSIYYPLTTRLTLYSGINYTYLHSKFSIKSNPNNTYDQKLHYLGVPLGLSYRLWSDNHFQLYVSGGAMLEKCLNKKPWQWSIEGAVGAEYNITRPIGFYLEPSLSYYFNDGTSFDHYYKEHPFAPSIEFGIRLHLDK